MNIFRRVGYLIKAALAARRIRKSIGQSDRDLARKALAEIFADARGVTMKMGQLMASPGDCAPGGSDPFADLVTSVDPIALADITPMIEKGLGCSLSDVFERLDESQAAASLGQVHHGVLKDGRQVALKVRYPGIDEAVAAEMALAGLMPGVGPVKKWGFNLGGYKKALKDNMDRELDYRDEAARQISFGERVHVPGLIVPAVLKDLSSRTILVQDWYSGVRLADVGSWDEKARHDVGRILLTTLFNSLFMAGVIHGDPHPGNTYFRQSDDGNVDVVLMDYGCTVEVGEMRRLALLKLILGLREGTNVSPLQAFAAMGFEPEKLALIADKLPELAAILLEPFLLDRPFDLSQWKLKDRFDVLLGENRWWFRSAGPPSGLLLLRAFQGLTQQLGQIGGVLDWGQILIQTLPHDLLEKARSVVLPALPETIAGTVLPSYAGVMRDTQPPPFEKKQAEHLRVRVRDETSELVSVTMPAKAALNLENLMPEEVAAHIRKTGEIDLDAILERLNREGLHPQEILEFEKPPKRYRIWLE